MPADRAGEFVNLSDMLDDEASDDESDAASDDGDEAADDVRDPARALELAPRLARYVCALRTALGEAQFGGLCATLRSEEERHAVAHALTAA